VTGLLLGFALGALTVIGIGWWFLRGFQREIAWFVSPWR
jgi:hypothetical protein